MTVLNGWVQRINYIRGRVMCIKSELLLNELKVALTDYANHIDLFLQKIGSNENIKIYNRHHSSSNSENICIQAMIYKTYQNYGENLIDFDEPIPEAPQVMDTKVVIKNINKKGISYFIKHHDLDFPFFALLAKANPHTDLVTSFENRKLFIIKSEIRLLKTRIKLDRYILEVFEKGTWKTIRKKLNALDNIKF
jgi:hypothetical protein